MKMKNNTGMINNPKYVDYVNRFQIEQGVYNKTQEDSNQNDYNPSYSG